MVTGLNFKTVLVLGGAVCTVVGIAINNWKVATVGNSIVLGALVFIP